MPTPVKNKRFISVTLPRRAEKAISSFSNLGGWQYRLIGGSADVAIQYKIESANKNVDESTRKASTVRTVLRIGLGTVSGIIIRFVAEKMGVVFVKKSLEKQELYKGSRSDTDKWIKSNIKNSTHYKNNYMLSEAGELFKKEQIKKSADYSIKKYSFKRLAPNKKTIDNALIEHLDFVQKLPKAFGNTLALIVAIVTTISVEPFLTDKLFNYVMQKIKKGKKDEVSN